MVCLFLGGWVFCALLDPPSKYHYNPSKTYSSQQGADADFMPPPNIDPITKTTKQTTDKEIEDWRASRSALAAQWKASDMSEVTFRVGLLGIILLVWTIIETFKAGEKMSEQNDIALKASKAEFQPYVGFEKAIPIKGVNNWMVENSGRFLKIEGDCWIENTGKTPMFDVSYSAQSKLTFINSPMNPFKTVEIDSELPSKKIFEYLGASDKIQVPVIGSVSTTNLELVVSDKNDWKQVPVRDVGLEITIRLSFKDSFSDNRRREFIANYYGKLNVKKINISKYHEVKQHTNK